MASSADFPTFIFPRLSRTLHCMTLTEEDLHEFQELWKSTFHEELPLDDARLIAAGVMELYSLLAQPRTSHSGDQTHEESNEVFPLLQKIE